VFAEANVYFRADSSKCNADENFYSQLISTEIETRFFHSLFSFQRAISRLS